MNQADAIDALKRAAQFLRTSPDAGVRAVGAEFFRWVEGNGNEHMEQAFGLGLPGPRSLPTTRTIAERDRLFFEASIFFPNVSRSAQAEVIAAELERYQTTAWTRGERSLGKCPPRHAKSVRAVFWQILKLQDRTFSARHLRRILATSSRDLANETD